MKNKEDEFKKLYILMDEAIKKLRKLVPYTIINSEEIEEKICLN